MINIIFLTGVSGAGKSTAAHALEERGFRIIENIPNEVLPELLEDIKKKPESYGKTALVQDIRHARTSLSILGQTGGIRLMSIALTCSKNELFTRFRLTRHIHPLQAKGYLLEQAIDEDTNWANEIRSMVDLYLDTTEFSSGELRESIFANLKHIGDGGMVISFLSFGYKYGVPSDADFVFDSRHLPNPYWVEELRDFTGLDQPVIDFLKSKRAVASYIKSIASFIEPIFEQSVKLGRKFIFVYVGCTGGQHRSVYVANALYELFKDKYYCMIAHRDIHKSGKTL